MHKKRVLVFASHYLPGYKAGGPIRSLDNIFAQLGNDVEFYLVTLNRDHGENKPYKGVYVNRWTKVGNVSVYYIDEDFPSKKTIVSIIDNLRPDSIYLNSLFSFGFSIHVLWVVLISKHRNIRVTLAPRGELSRGALEQGRYKKLLFILLSKHIYMYKKIVWHASSNYEYDDIINAYGSFVNIKIASNLVDAAVVNSRSSFNLNRIKNEVRIIFVSRISKKKNLDYAIESLSSLSGKVVFDVYGPFEDKLYVNKCKKIASKMPNNINISFKGDVKHSEVSKLFKKYDVFYFPTKGENFGQVIWESMSCGCPVLISDQTPWDKVEKHNAGWIRSLANPDDFTEVLQGIVNNEKGYLVNRHDVCKYAFKISNTRENITANKKIFMN